MKPHPFSPVVDNCGAAHRYLGIDPGVNGAIAVICDTTVIVIDLPIVKVKRKGGTKSEYNLPELRSLLRVFRNEPFCTVVIEEALVQIAGKGSNAYTAYRVGVGYGMLVGMLAGLGLPYEKVHPTVWKRAMGLLKKDKEDSRLKALGMFPQADILRKKDEGRSEALLLAEYCRRRCNGKL